MLALVKEYFWIFFISMVPIVELRGAVPAGLAMGLPVIPTYIVSVIGNMLSPSSCCLPRRFCCGVPSCPAGWAVFL